MDRDDRLTSRLLGGRDQLSRLEKDAILDGVLGGPPARRMRWAWLALPALAAAAALFVIGPWRSSSPGEFTARGGDQPAAVLHVGCASGCTQGAKLAFDVHGTTGYRYFAAFAKAGDGKAIWYFPASDDATGIDLTAQPSTGVLDRAVVRGAPHPAGTYRIYGVFSQAPLTRSQIRDAFDPKALSAGAGTSVVVSDVEVR